MKRLTILLTLIIAATASVSAQKLVIGDRAPQITVKNWITAAPSVDGKAVMVEFYHSSNKSSAARLSALADLARTADGKLAVIVVTREDSADVAATLAAGNPAYSAGVDDGTTFSAFSAQYVPYSVIYDRRGRIVWLGNPSSLSTQDILGMIN